MSIKSPIVVICTFLWIGFVTGISFLEAPLKFQAPHITLALGLGIGRLVFAALNKVEWVFALSIAFSLFRQQGGWGDKKLLFAVPILTLLVQTIWLLPALDARAELHIQGAAVPSSYLHVYYVLAEVIKIGCLLAFGLKLFQKLVFQLNVSTHSVKQTVS